MLFGRIAIAGPWRRERRCGSRLMSR